MVRHISIFLTVAAASNVIWAAEPPVNLRVALAGKTDAAPADRIQIVGSSKDVVLAITLSVTDGATRQFRYDNVPQLFGVYVLGPWGPVQPDPSRVRAENWMHQQQSQAPLVTIGPDAPFRVEVSLSQYFETSDPEKFGPGVYQVNVKFYEAASLGMARPVDSGPIRFRVPDREGISDGGDTKGVATGEAAVHGTWEEILVSRGRSLGPPPPEQAAAAVTFDPSAMTMVRTVVGIPVVATCSLDSSQTPKRIDIIIDDDGKKVTIHGVYALKNDVLILKVGQPGHPRPTSIDFHPDEARVSYAVLARKRSGPPPKHDE